MDTRFKIRESFYSRPPISGQIVYQSGRLLNDVIDGVGLLA